jgi:hypothetical protein
MRKHLLAGAALLCLVVGALTATAGGQAGSAPQVLAKTSGTITPGGQQAYTAMLAVNDHLTVWVGNAAPPGSADLRARVQRWGFSASAPGSVTMIDVVTMAVPAGTTARLDKVATATAPYQLVIDAPGAQADVPFSLDPTTTPGSGAAEEHQGRAAGASSHIVATPPHGHDVRYLSEPAAGLSRWRVDLAPGDNLAAQIDHLAFERPGTPVVACVLGPAGDEVASVSAGPEGAVLRYSVPVQGHYTIDVGCRPDAPPSAFRPYFTPRPGRVPGSTSFVGAGRLVPKAGTQNGGALDRYWRIDLEAGDVLDLWFASVDSETAQGTICIDGPPPTGGLTRVAAQTVAHGQAGHLVMAAPWSGRYVINGACVPGDGLFEMFVN